MTKKHLIMAVVILSFLALLVAPAALAQNLDINMPASNYIPTNMNAWETAENIIDALLAFLGLIAVVIILIGGFQWMTAAGNEDKVKTAKRTLSAGIIGLVIVLAAWGIARFVIDLLAKTAVG